MLTPVLIMKGATFDISRLDMLVESRTYLVFISSTGLQDMPSENDPTPVLAAYTPSFRTLLHRKDQ